MGALKTRANPLEEPGPDNPDKEPLKIRIEIVGPDKELSDLQGCFGAVVFFLVTMVLTVAVAVHQTYEFLEPLFSMVERLVRWMLGG